MTFRCMINFLVLSELAAYPLTVILISRVSLITADLVVLVVTWITTYRTATISRVALNHNRPTLSALLLRDGTLYFL